MNKIDEIKLAIYESYEDNKINKDQKDELISTLESTAYNRHHAFDTRGPLTGKTNSLELGKELAAKKAFNTEVGIKNDKTENEDEWEAGYVARNQKDKIKEELKKHDKKSQDKRDPNKNPNLSLKLSSSGHVGLVDTREEKKKELLKRIEKRKSNK